MNDKQAAFVIPIIFLPMIFLMLCYWRGFFHHQKRIKKIFSKEGSFQPSISLFMFFYGWSRREIRNHHLNRTLRRASAARTKFILLGFLMTAIWFISVMIGSSYFFELAL